MSATKACVALGQITAYMETLEMLPFRELTMEELDKFATAARALKRAAETLVTELENVEGYD